MGPAPLERTRVNQGRTDLDMGSMTNLGHAIGAWTRRAAAPLALALVLPASAGDWRQVAPGLAVRHDVLDEPWAIHAIRFERARTNFSLVPSLAFHSRIGLNTLSAQVRLVPARLGRPIAAINGDFYQTEHEAMPGDPRGLFIRSGELVSAPTQRDCFWITPEGEPRIGEVRSAFSLTLPDGTALSLGLNEHFEGSDPVLFTAAGGEAPGSMSGRALRFESPDEKPWPALRIGDAFTARVAGRRRDREDPVKPGEWVLMTDDDAAKTLKPGATVKVGFGTTPSLAGVRTAIGGGPALLREGKVTSLRANKSNERHPRSALGWNQEHFFLVVVDGRQPELSVGMTLRELAQTLSRLGATEAMNLDGGGSTELILRGRILNSPCYGHERATATGLVLVEQNPAATGDGSP
jgi:exopolysaccharide biosynthesis protein